MLTFHAQSPPHVSPLTTKLSHRSLAHCFTDTPPMLQLSPDSHPSHRTLTEVPQHRPGSTCQLERRSRVACDHEQEWLASGVDPAIVALNVETLTDTEADFTEALYPIAERLHWTITRFGQQARTYLRGWWVSGVDPLNQWQRMAWGRFKPDATTPVHDRTKGKPAKYLSPSLGSGSSRLVLLDVPLSIWQRVATRYQLAISPDDIPQGFWKWVLRHNVPVMLTEGEKKAGCLLTAGYAAIALPGIFNGYRKAPHALIPDLAVFATPGRIVSICFDYETKPKTVQNVQIAIAKLGNLLQKARCTVHVITLPGPEKGVDDFIVSQGVSTFEAIVQTALPLDRWSSQQLWALTYPVALQVNRRYLGDIPYPQSGLACIKSAKGTGKTTALQPLIHQATQTGRKVLVITHRIQLGRAICQSIGIDWIEEVKKSETQGVLGYGLCIDSLHSQSQARFAPEIWKGAIVILDEVEQIIWHLLNSKTCYEKRLQILATLKELIETVLSTGGLIIAQDADLSNISIDYLKGLTEIPIEPWVVVNQWQPEEAWPVHYYDTKNPSSLIAQMERLIQTGAVFVAVDTQRVSGRWSCTNLETYLHNRFPGKRILRIDSETVANPKHPAYGIVDRLNEALPHYDIVIATPTIGTGVSINIRGHFQAVFGIFQGVTADAESRQALARVREAVPRYVWAASFGPGKVGNGSCNYQEVIRSTTKAVKYNIALLKAAEFDLDTQTDPVSLRTWAKMAARVNTSLWQFRTMLRQGLAQEGHLIAVLTDGDSPGVVTTMSQIQTTNRHQEATAIADSPDLTPNEYTTLKDKRAKTLEERHAQQKYELQHRYGIAVTPDLKLKDDQGWYTQLRLHYYLTHDPAYLRLRDLHEWQRQCDRGNGKISLQDVRLLTAQVETLKVLGILAMLDPTREVRATDTDVEQLRHQAIQFRQDIKTILNVTISPQMTEIEIVQVLLGKLGIKLHCIGRDLAPNGKRAGIRVYQFLGISDDRDRIFAQWEQRDQLMQQTHANPVDDSETWSDLGLPDPPPDTLNTEDYLDGSLPLKSASDHQPSVRTTYTKTEKAPNCPQNRSGDSDYQEIGEDTRENPPETTTGDFSARSHFQDGNILPDSPGDRLN